MTAITEQRKTAWYLMVLDERTGFDTYHRDAEGHIYFSDQVARQIARGLRTMPIKSGGNSIKTVVTGYTD